MTFDCEALRRDYLDLLKKCLTASLYPESSDSPVYPVPRSRSFYLVRALVRTLGIFDYRLLRVKRFNVEERERGVDWPSFGYSMIGLTGLSNLQECIETVLRDNVPGDLIETGAWRGGACIFMRAVLRVYNSERRVWVADSFEGLPSATTEQDREFGRTIDLSGHPYLAASLEEVQENFKRFGLLDGQVKFLKGWFKNTLPSAPIEKLAILRLDGDMYESTMDVLTNLYTKVSHGGFIIVDDYHTWKSCRRAIDEFRTRHEIKERLEEVDGSRVYWRRD